MINDGGEEMDILIGILLAVAAGTCAALQPVVNAGVSKIVGNLEAAIVSIGVSFFALSIVVFFFGNGDLTKLSQVPKYLLIGGLLGIIVVVTSMMSVKLLGAAVAISLVVTTQKLVSTISDHFGWFGSQVIPIDIWRVIGLILMIVGVRVMMFK